MERSDQRDAAIRAMLPHVSEHGWSMKALRGGLRDAGHPPGSDAWLFDGPADMVEAYIDCADRRMRDAAATLTQAGLSRRVRALIALRLAQAAPERAAIRRAAGVLALPGNAATAARSLARTSDAIWRAAGDRSADVSWYTRRATLAAVYSATLLRWLALPDGVDDTDALAFLDRRLAGVARIGKLRARLAAALAPQRASLDPRVDPPTQPSVTDPR